MSGQPGDGWRMVEMAGDLARQGVEFALATVVWRQAPSSGHQGRARSSPQTERCTAGSGELVPSPS